MAEQYVPHQESSSPLVADDALSPQENQQQSYENNLIHVDFRPDLSRQEIMHRIGEVVTSWWLTEAGSGAISHVPLSVTDSPNGLGVRFKQYKRGFAGDELGIPHLEGWSGLETINVLDVKWNASSHTIDPQYVHPRNFRYILPRHEANRAGAANDTTTIGQELWGE